MTVETLDNGLRVTTEEMGHMRSAAVTIWIGAGARYEEARVNGVSHFIEHMLFKGTAKRDSNLKISAAIEGVGGTINGFTNKETTCFLVKVPSESFGLGLDVLADMVLHSRFDPEALERERGVVIEEIKMVRDRPDSWVHILLEEMVWPDQPLGRSVAGTEDVISAMSREQVLEYFEAQYRPGNMVVSVAGKVSAKDVRDAVEASFGARTGGKPGGLVPARPAPKGPVARVERRDTKQANLALGLPGYERLHPRRYVLEILNVILGWGMSSRLFQEVRVKRSLAYSVGSQYSAYLDTGIVRVYAGVDPSKGATAVSVILEQLARMRDEAIADEELRKAKDFYKGALALRLEDTLNLALRNGEHMVLTGQIVPVDEVLAKVDAVTAQDIAEVASDLFKKENICLAAVGPFEKEDDMAAALKSSVL
ncbi:MAG: insulinase family protein [Firmicutes bacterium]|nr:insulinase family protein [Bacillota bacterium]MDH7495974.1 pitrilysin family protein [Bacillota bacterium]